MKILRKSRGGWSLFVVLLCFGQLGGRYESSNVSLCSSPVCSSSLGSDVGNWSDFGSIWVGNLFGEVGKYLGEKRILPTMQFCAAQLSVVSPPEVVAELERNKALTATGTLHVATASFGGGDVDVVAGHLLYTADDEDVSEGKHCKADYCERLRLRNDQDSKKVPKFFLVDRGLCSFTDKALVAQNCGAVGMVIAAKETDGGRSTLSRIILTRSDKGGKVSIPVVMIAWEDAETLKKRIHENIFVRFGWDAVAKWPARVEITAALNNPDSMDFLFDFSKFAQLFKNEISIQIRYFLQNSTLNSNSDKNCVTWNQERLDHKYCLSPLSLATAGGASPLPGSFFVEETVRQLCLVNMNNTANPSEKLLYQPHFWKYIEVFWDPAKGCKYTLENPENPRLLPECSLKIAQQILDDQHFQHFQHCVNNPPLQHLLEQTVNSPIPFQTLNHIRFPGRPDAGKLAKAICVSSVSSETEKEQFPHCLHTVTGMIAEVEGEEPEEDSIPGWALLNICVFCVALFCFGTYLCIRYQKDTAIKLARREAVEQIRNEISAEHRTQRFNQLHDAFSDDDEF